MIDITLAESTQNEVSKSDSNTMQNETIRKEYRCWLRAKIGFRKQEGYQPELVCLLHWSNHPPVVNAISVCTRNNVYDYNYAFIFT